MIFLHLPRDKNVRKIFYFFLNYIKINSRKYIRLEDSLILTYLLPIEK